MECELNNAEASGDFLINMKVILPVRNTQELVRVLSWKCNPDVSLVGLVYANPMLDTCVYKVGFPNRRTDKLVANVIVQVGYAPCDQWQSVHHTGCHRGLTEESIYGRVLE